MRSFAEYYYNDEIMENQMDGACSMHVTEGNECIAVA
jgi:hypothetical protein